MAETAEKKKVVPMPSRKKSARQRIRMLSKQAASDVFSRQVEEQDMFEKFYGPHQLLVPPYDFIRLYQIFEESDALQECVEAMVENVDGFGYELVFNGDDLTEKDTPAAQQQMTQLENIFDHANEDHSMQTVRKRMRADFEVLGNGAMEVIRNLRGEIAMFYHAPMRQFRMGRKKGREVTVTAQIPRNGQLIPVRVRKKFRKWAQVTSDGKSIRWFKAFGDPRQMDYRTGQYATTVPMRYRATEILHFRNYFAGMAYGIPRWIAALLEVLGRRNSQYVNWDLFESQGIPPMAVLVSGGTLTDESIEDLEDLIRSLRGVQQWNKVMLLESNIESVGLEDKGSAKIELKNLNEFRKDDLMFKAYGESTHDNIRFRYRLPPIYVGSAETYTHATAKASQTIAEEQVFTPERMQTDEVMNKKIIQNEFGIFDWSYKSKGPQLAGSEDIRKGVESFTKAGALSVNTVIDLANRAFGTNITKYDDQWAKIPIAIVLKLLENQQIQLRDTDDIVDVIPQPAQPSLPLPAPEQAVNKILKTDLFDEDEKELYRQLLVVQDLVDRFTNAERRPEI